MYIIKIKLLTVTGVTYPLCPEEDSGLHLQLTLTSHMEQT